MLNIFEKSGKYIVITDCGDMHIFSESECFKFLLDYTAQTNCLSIIMSSEEVKYSCTRLLMDNFSKLTSVVTEVLKNAIY